MLLMASPSLHRIFSPHTLDAWAAIFKKDNATARGESRFGVFSLNANALSAKGTKRWQLFRNSLAEIVLSTTVQHKESTVRPHLIPVKARNYNKLTQEKI